MGGICEGEDVRIQAGLLGTDRAAGHFRWLEAVERELDVFGEFQLGNAQEELEVYIQDKEQTMNKQKEPSRKIT